MQIPAFLTSHLKSVVENSDMVLSFVCGVLSKNNQVHMWSCIQRVQAFQDSKTGGSCFESWGKTTHRKRSLSLQKMQLKGN